LNYDDRYNTSIGGVGFNPDPEVTIGGNSYYQYNITSLYDQIIFWNVAMPNRIAYMEYSLPSTSATLANTTNPVPTPTPLWFQQKSAGHLIPNGYAGTFWNAAAVPNPAPFPGKIQWEFLQVGLAKWVMVPGTTGNLIPTDIFSTTATDEPRKGFIKIRLGA
jgi:hypothetical protein